MKKLSAFVLSALLLAVGAVFFVSCGGNDGGNSQAGIKADVYAPDGAPALALAQLMSEDMQFGGEVTYNIVSADTIQTYVNAAEGNEPAAELAILPVNAAAKVLGTGEKYQMLGAVTHGNLYILAKTDDVKITSSNIAEMFEGKKVGCLQLNNFVGYVLRTVLAANEIKVEVRTDIAEENTTTDTAYLYNANGQQITPASDFDLMIAAEPAVNKKISAATPLYLAGDLQALYGADGYPQAVLVAKNSIIEENPEFIGDFIAAVDASAEWIKTAPAQTVYDAILENNGGATPSFGVTDLTPEVIGRCAVRFEGAQEIKDRVKTFLSEISVVAGQTFTVADAFFYAPRSTTAS